MFGLPGEQHINKAKFLGRENKAGPQFVGTATATAFQSQPPGQCNRVLNVIANSSRVAEDPMHEKPTAAEVKHGRASQENEHRATNQEGRPTPSRPHHSQTHDEKDEVEPVKQKQHGERRSSLLDEAMMLGDALGPLLVQLPPSLRFDADVAGGFFAMLRSRFAGEVACEPRHATWFTAKADVLLRDALVARVAADPAVVPAAAEPGGWRGLAYHRLHGSPRMYYSSYPPESIHALDTRMREDVADGREAWCIFDNTASGAATANALELAAALASTE